MNLGIKILFVLVMDPRLIAESSGDLLLVKIPSPHKLLQLNFAPGMFSSIDAGSLLVVDNVLLENLNCKSRGGRLVPTMWAGGSG